MISNLISNFTSAVGTEYFLFVYAFFIMLIVVYIFIDRFKK